MKSLEVFNLTGNKISSVPKEICACLRLKSLSLDCNNVGYVCKEIYMLPDLEELCLSGNCLKVLPNTLHRLTNLLVLTLDNNPGLLYIPGSIAKIKDFSYFSVNRCFGNHMLPEPNNTIDKETASKCLAQLRCTYSLTCVELDSCPISLKNLAARKLFLGSMDFECVPNFVSQMAAAPTGFCHVCECPIFATAQYLFLTVEEILKVGVRSASIEMYLNRMKQRGAPFLLLFCSTHCSKKFCKRGS